MEGRESSVNPVTKLLHPPRYELMPFESFHEQIYHLPDDAIVTVTASPQKPIEATIEYTLAAKEAGFPAIPHIAARMIRDRDHLDSIASRIKDAGISDIFVPGGDLEEPEGEYESALDLLEELELLGIEFEEVGITGYPEGHPEIPPNVLAQAMERKAPYASYIVTQICYDPHRIIAWIDEIRDRGVSLPVYIGMPGVMRYQKLIGISRRVGVGQSIRFIQKTSGIMEFIREAIGSRGTFYPDDIIDGLATVSMDPHYNIAGTHLYSFNRTQDTEAWRTQRMH